jgi:hypothetical protein
VSKVLARLGRSRSGDHPELRRLVDASAVTGEPAVSGETVLPETSMIGRTGSRPIGSSAVPTEATPAPTYRCSAYVVFPTRYDEVNDPSRSRWCLTVADSGDGWVIRRQGECLNIFNQWQMEVPLEMRDAEFRRRCLYNEHAALLRARRVVDRLDIGGLTFEEFIWQVSTSRR